MAELGSAVLCSKPSDDVMNKVKNDKNSKTGEKRIAKKKRAQGDAPLIADAIVTEGAITLAQPLAIDQAVAQPLAIKQEAQKSEGR